MIKENREDGVSFVVRCHNEESTIYDCITSLSSINVPYEIIVVLHRCSDKSKEIVDNLKAAGHPVKIFEYDVEISKAGFDTLITPTKHPRSLMTYYNYCFSKANFNWLFKWDADFKASEGLVKFINSIPIGMKEPTVVKISCRLGDHITSEYYLNNCLVDFGKHMFWEVGLYKQGLSYYQLQDDVLIESIDKNIIKNYWSNLPWYAKEESKDENFLEKKKLLVDFVGEEPTGFARCCNYDMSDVYYKIMNNENYLSTIGIKLWE